MTDVTENRDRAEAELSVADEQVLRELTERARTGGLKLTGEGGLLGRLTKMVVEGALEGELDDHLGYAKNDPEGRDGGNFRNGYRAKTVMTDSGRWRSACRGTGMPASSRKSSPKGSGGCPGSMRRSFPFGERADARGDRRAPGRGLRRRGL